VEYERAQRDDRLASDVGFTSVGALILDFGGVLTHPQSDHVVQEMADRLSVPKASSNAPTGSTAPPTMPGCPGWSIGDRSWPSWVIRGARAVTPW